MSEKFAALKAGDSFDFMFCDNPICPHCGTEFSIRENEAWELYDENGPHEITCDGCEREFSVFSHAKWTFSTDEQEEE